MKNRKGFTLIELLVVIAIIGILAALILVSLSQSRKKARDARRKSDITSIAKALEMYYTDKEEYPRLSSTCGGYVSQERIDRSYSGFCEDVTAKWGWLPKLLTSDYIKKIPVDPINNTSGYYYSYHIDRRFLKFKNFAIMAVSLENKSDSQRCYDTDNSLTVRPFYIYSSYPPTDINQTYLCTDFDTYYNSFGINNSQGN